MIDFKRGRTSLEGEPHEGRLKTATTRVLYTASAVFLGDNMSGVE